MQNLWFAGDLGGKSNWDEHCGTGEGLGNEGEKSMRSILKVLSAIGVLSAGGVFGEEYAMLVNVNFQGAGEVMTAAAGAGSAGDYWNAVSYGTMDLQSNLLDSSGNTTTIDMQKSTWGTGLCNGSSSDSTKLFRAYTDANNEPTEAWHTLSLSGMDASETYDIYLYSGWNWSSDSINFRIGGATKQADEDNTTVLSYEENKNYVVFRDIVPDASGNLLVEYGNEVGSFNGFQIGLVDRPEYQIELINVNFTRYDEIMSGAAGIGETGDVWNHVPGNSVSLHQNLLDCHSNATSVAVRKSGYNWGSCSGGSGDSTPLFRGYTHAGDNPVEEWHTLDLTGLETGQRYDIYLYSGWNWSTDTVAFATGSITNQPAEDNTEVLSYMEDGNYIVFRNVKADIGGRILVEYKNSAAAFSGLQIAKSPPRGSLFIVK